MKTFIGGIGCFWDETKYENIDGIISTECGYCGGDDPNITYKAVCGGDTGHIEVVKVQYDEKIKSYEEMVRLFFKLHDSTQVNRQGAYVGIQYRSEIFYSNDEEKKIAEKAPVDGIKIDNLVDVIKESEEVTNNSFFSYSIKIADFYFKDSAKNMSARIISETNVKNPIIQILSKTKYRVLLGPFNDIKKLEKTFNEIKSLNFENIEILKNV